MTDSDCKTWQSRNTPDYKTRQTTKAKKGPKPKAVVKELCSLTKLRFSAFVQLMRVAQSAYKALCWFNLPPAHVKLHVYHVCVYMCVYSPQTLCQPWFRGSLQPQLSYIDCMSTLALRCSPLARCVYVCMYVCMYIYNMMIYYYMIIQALVW